MALDLSRVGDRERLKPKAGKAPHYQRLRIGCYLGYRPSTVAKLGTWVVRAYDDDKGKYAVKSLGDYGHLAGKDMFAAAKRDAEAYADLIESGGHVAVKLETVADACRAYAENRPEAEARFRRYVYDDTIARVKLDKLRRRHLQEWRNRQEQRPALVSRSKEGERRTRPRAASTLNRDMVVLRAALSKVMAQGRPNTEAAWQEALRPVPNADGRRTLYLDPKQRKSLLDALDAESRPFVHGLCLLPLRPGALASLSVGDFDKRTHELTVGKDKTGEPRRFKLPDNAAALFLEQAKDKLPTAPLFMRANGNAWDKDSWKRPIKGALAAAGLPPETSAYTLRHSTITDLVTAGLPLLTVAQISGTSAEMIERHYGHLTSDAAVKALGALAL